MTHKHEDFSLCKKSFSTKQYKENHEKICNNNSIINENIAINRPTTHNQRINNIIYNLTPITENYLNEQAEHLTLDHIKNGVNGYVQYDLEYPLHP